MRGEGPSVIELQCCYRSLSPKTFYKAVRPEYQHQDCKNVICKLGFHTAKILQELKPVGRFNQGGLQSKTYVTHKFNINYYTTAQLLLLYKATCFDLLNGHLQTFKHSETTDVYMLGSRYVYIDKIHKIRQVSYLERRDICIV